MIRLTPRAGRDEIAGPHTLADGRDAIAVRVRAIPEKGAANTALEKLVAGALAVPRSRVRVVSGHRDRLKTVHVAGDAEALATLARSMVGTGSR